MNHWTAKKINVAIDEKINSLPKEDKVGRRYWNEFKHFIQTFDNSSFTVTYKTGGQTEMCGIYKLCIGSSYLIGRTRCLYEMKSNQQKGLSNLLNRINEAAADSSDYHYKTATYLIANPMLKKEATIEIVEECTDSELLDRHQEWNKKVAKDPKCLNNNLK